MTYTRKHYNHKLNKLCSFSSKRLWYYKNKMCSYGLKSNFKLNPREISASPVQVHESKPISVQRSKNLKDKVLLGCKI